MSLKIESSFIPVVIREGLSVPGFQYIPYGTAVTRRYFIELDGATSYYQLTTPLVAIGNFNIPFQFYTSDTVGTITILGESGSGLNEVYVAAGVLKVEVVGVEHKFSTAPAVADSKLHSGVIVRVGTTITLILDGVTYAEDSVTPSTGNFTLDVYGQSNSTEFFGGILANIDGIPLGLPTGNTEGNAIYVNITDAQREEYQLNEAGTIWNNISTTQLLPATIEIATSPQWTLGYDGISVYGQLTDVWQPTGSDWRVLITTFTRADGGMILSEATGTDPYIRVIPAFSVEVGNGNGSFNTNGESAEGLAVIEYNSSSELIVNGVIVATDTPNAVYNEIGRYAGGLYFDGQIHLIELIDNDDPTNSITINNVITSATQPTDFNIYDELTGDVIGSYFNGVYEIVEDGG